MTSTHYAVIGKYASTKTGETVKKKTTTDILGEKSEAVNLPWLIVHSIGFGACLAWVHISFFSPTLWSETNGASLLSWLLNIISNGAAMIIIGALRCF